MFVQSEERFNAASSTHYSQGQPFPLVLGHQEVLEEHCAFSARLYTVLLVVYAVSPSLCVI